jgi:hypothetical protein
MDQLRRFFGDKDRTGGNSMQAIQPYPFLSAEIMEAFAPKAVQLINAGDIAGLQKALSEQGILERMPDQALKVLAVGYSIGNCSSSRPPWMWEAIHAFEPIYSKGWSMPAASQSDRDAVLLKFLRNGAPLPIYSSRVDEADASPFSDEIPTILDGISTLDPNGIMLRGEALFPKKK